MTSFGAHVVSLRARNQRAHCGCLNRRIAKHDFRQFRPQRIDDYAAHFHHHPWQDAQLSLTPRLLKRLGGGVGGTVAGEAR